jgi:hypothetical protein
VKDWSEVHNLAQDDMFEPRQSILILNLGELTISQAGADLVARVSTSRMYFVREKNLLAREKKEWETAGNQIQVLDKISTSDRANFIKDYSSKIGVNVPTNQFTNLVSQNLDFIELSNILDLFKLSEQDPGFWKWMATEVKPEPFMLPFTLYRLEKDIPRWLNTIEEDQIQLALSLIFTKLDKQLISSDYKGRQILQNLIQTDHNIKTKSWLSPTLWWKLFLWQSLNS